GARASGVIWVPTGATTIGANSHLIGTVNGAPITIGANSDINGMGPAKVMADTYQTDFINEVKEWSKSSSSISDATLLNDMNMHGTHIPSWFKKVAEWASSGQIDQNDFVNAVKYVHENEMTK
ncbi:MAG TPA: hypothetical protein VFG24_03220, partial [Nitrosopumilaceae archaeon]|nr:hypothetical protein [Nitrosopumilaceae archaeon]